MARDQQMVFTPPSPKPGRGGRLLAQLTDQRVVTETVAVDRAAEISPIGVSVGGVMSMCGGVLCLFVVACLLCVLFAD